MFLPKFKHLFFIFLFSIGIFNFAFFIFNLRLTANAAISNASRIIPFQGTLTNSSGNYVADGNYSIVFAIYTVASGGIAAWSETDTVAVTNGAFAVNIGANDANGVNLAMDTPPYYLGIKVGANAEMSPRVQLAFSPFAMTAKNMSGVYTDASGNVGIGTTAPGQLLDVQSATHNRIRIGSSLANPSLGFEFIESGVAKGYIQRQSGNRLSFYSGDGTTEDMVILDSGNVGIGTTNPSTKLVVAGPMIRTIAYAQGWGVDASCDNETIPCSAALAARVLTFNKTSASTKIRAAYVDTMRSYSASPATVHICQWELKFDGASCPSGNIKGVVYSYPTADPHETRSIWGYCSGLGAGSHTIQAYVMNYTGNPGRCYTGWPGDTNWTIEAEEVN